MKLSDHKRLIGYSLLLPLLVGGVAYLTSNLDNSAPKSEPPQVQASQDIAATVPFSPKSFEYKTKEPGRGGSGKVYMDREISLVMGHEAINWLERDNREDEEASSKAVKGLELKSNAVVADIGSGSGYYTFRITPLVPKGKVIGVDIQPEMVTFLRQKAAKLKVANVESHLGKINTVQLPAASVDAVILVDAYHEFSHPNEMMQSIVYALKPGGRVYLLEYRAEDPEVPIKTLHKMSEAQSVKEMKAVGLRHLRTESFLPWQHFMIYEK